MRIRYRLWQVWQALAGRPLSESAWHEIAAHLSPAELTLFARYQPADRRHAYRVLLTLKAAGHNQPSLLAAALLHDIGKTCFSTPLWARSLAVVGEKVFSNKTAAWATDDATGWRRAFLIKKQHAALGADLTAQVGSSDLTSRLIRRHQDPLPLSVRDIEDQLLLSLQWADNQN